jgi:membrane protease YdiL (CAAX protease family)
VSWSPVLVIGFLLVRSREGWPGIGLSRSRAADLGLGLVLWVASFVLVLVLAQLFQPLGTREVDFLPEGLPLWFRALQAVGIAVTAGVTEEVVVRGYAQTRLEQLRAPTAVILLLPTALWACSTSTRGGPDHLRPGAAVRLVLPPDTAAVAADPGPHPVRHDPAGVHPGRA